MTLLNNWGLVLLWSLRSYFKQIELFGQGLFHFPVKIWKNLVPGRLWRFFFICNLPTYLPIYLSQVVIRLHKARETVFGPSQQDLLNLFATVNFMQPTKQASEARIREKQCTLPCESLICTLGSSPSLPQAGATAGHHVQRERWGRELLFFWAKCGFHSWSGKSTCLVWWAHCRHHRSKSSFPHLQPWGILILESGMQVLDISPTGCHSWPTFSSGLKMKLPFSALDVALSMYNVITQKVPIIHKSQQDPGGCSCHLLPLPFQ